MLDEILKAIMAIMMNLNRAGLAKATADAALYTNTNIHFLERSKIDDDANFTSSGFFFTLMTFAFLIMLCGKASNYSNRTVLFYPKTYPKRNQETDSEEKEAILDRADETQAGEAKSSGCFGRVVAHTTTALCSLSQSEGCIINLISFSLPLDLPTKLTLLALLTLLTHFSELSKMEGGKIKYFSVRKVITYLNAAVRSNALFQSSDNFLSHISKSLEFSEPIGPLSVEGGAAIKDLFSGKITIKTFYILGLLVNILLTLPYLVGYQRSNDKLCKPLIENGDITEEQQPYLTLDENEEEPKTLFDQLYQNADRLTKWTNFSATVVSLSSFATLLLDMYLLCTGNPSNTGIRVGGFILISLPILLYPATKKANFVVTAIGDSNAALSNLLLSKNPRALLSDSKSKGSGQAPVGEGSRTRFTSRQEHSRIITKDHSLTKNYL